jgi:DNA-binding transcriptional ArsR family regulator
VVANAHSPNGLTALGDPTRRAIFERLRGGPLPVGEIARDLPVTRPAVSQHLKVLKDAGLVLDAADGNRRLYRIDPRGIEGLRAWLDQFWNEALDAYKEAVERPDEEV